MHAYGSSPLSRGILRRLPRLAARGRIIPALAGNTGFSWPTGRWSWDHPRSRGEYSAGCRRWLPGTGSSPLSRGIRFRRRLHTVPPGIIPALAGNTRVGSPSATASEDHPRSRGEYASRATCIWIVTGSSPLSRGIQVRTQRVGEVGGIIPALAGNTRSRPVSAA